MIVTYNIVATQQSTAISMGYTVKYILASMIRTHGVMLPMAEIMVLSRSHSWGINRSGLCFQRRFRFECIDAYKSAVCQISWLTGWMGVFVPLCYSSNVKYGVYFVILFEQLFSITLASLALFTLDIFKVLCKNHVWRMMECLIFTHFYPSQYQEVSWIIYIDATYLDFIVKFN